jgi:DNA-binding NtrC family response regulator
MWRILVVDDDAILRMAVRVPLQSRGYSVVEAEDGLQALDVWESEGPFNAVILDVNMPGKGGLEVLETIKQKAPETVCLMLTAFSNIKDAVVAIKNGAFDYIEKPVNGERLLALIDSAREASAMVEAAAFSAPQIQFDQGRTMIGGSSSIRKVFDVIYKLSKVDTSVLIRGESGTGKELVARALHYNSHRKKGPFVAVNCAAIPENLIESELFGHEKGSFTGADKKKLGRFQFAEGGTIFLDEIGDISLQMQVKLLRVLQERRLTPVGANSETPIDVRVVAATSRPLEKMMEQGTFRPDLFYRLNVLPINLPALRDRTDDIAPLVQAMIKKFNALHSRAMKAIVPQALQAMRAYAWPGNIRELENVIEHAFIVESGDTITLESLPEHVATCVMASVPTPRQGASKDEAATCFGLPDLGTFDFDVYKEAFEREFLIHAMRAFQGKINLTSEKTNINKVTLLRKLEKYNINPKSYHSGANPEA